MAKGDDEPKDKAVRDEMMRLLRERVHDPTMGLDNSLMPRVGTTRSVAIEQLTAAGHISSVGHITLDGMDYYRKETQPVRTWLRSNWFGVIVAGCTIVASTCGVVCG